MATNVIMWREGQSAWVNCIKKRINNNLNFMCFFEGPTGVGKSWSAISLAHKLDPEFDSREQIAFSFLAVMKILNKFKDKKNPLSKRKYKVLVFDETQITIGRREWASKINKLFLSLTSTFRSDNVIVLFTAPYSDYIDSATMKLIHARFECRGWNKKSKTSLIIPKFLQWSSKQQKFYEHFLRVTRIKGVKGNNKKLKTWKIKCPPEYLTKPYEEDKQAFNDKLQADLTQELQSLEDDANNHSPKGELNPESMQLDLWEEAQKGYSTQQELRANMSKRLGREVDIAQLSRNIMSMRKKGFDIRKYKRNRGDVPNLS